MNYDIADLIGARAVISTTQPHLWCEPNATFNTWSRAWAGPALWAGNNLLRWAQTGWWRHRPGGSTKIDYEAYLEVGAGGAVYVKYASFNNPPPPGSSYLFQVWLMNPAAGIWAASIGGQLWAIQDHPFWICGKANVCGYQGEVLQRQTDMPGIPGQPCHFTNCQVLTAPGLPSSSCSGGSVSSPTGWQDTQFTPTPNVLYNTDPSRWALQLIRAVGRNEDRTPKTRVLSSFLPTALSGTAFDIWDLCPGTNT